MLVVAALHTLVPNLNVSLEPISSLRRGRRPRFYPCGRSRGLFSSHSPQQSSHTALLSVLWFSGFLSVTSRAASAICFPRTPPYRAVDIPAPAVPRVAYRLSFLCVQQQQMRRALRTSSSTNISVIRAFSFRLIRGMKAIDPDNSVRITRTGDGIATKIH
jgi:hypothetical protein